jgi:exosortase
MKHAPSEARSASTIDPKPFPGSAVVPFSNSLIENKVKWRLIFFVLFTLTVIGLFWDTFVQLARLSSKEGAYSHMPLIPLVSGYFLFSKRRSILSTVRIGARFGAIGLLLGVMLYFVPIYLMPGLEPNDYLSVRMLAALAIWIGGFIALFGVHAFRLASFPLLFLVFLVPIPSSLLGMILQFLQEASTEVANAIFVLTGVPFVRNGFTFELPGISVMVAEQCSGIRSSIALFITGVLVAHLLLATGWRRLLLILSVVPITIFKNALRIITLSLLAVYVDKRILESALHRAGGIPFFGLALVSFGCVLWVLRWSEARDAAKRERP